MCYVTSIKASSIGTICGGQYHLDTGRIHSRSIPDKPVIWLVARNYWRVGSVLADSIDGNGIATALLASEWASDVPHKVSGVC